MPKPLLNLVFITAAVLFPLATWTGRWPLALIAGPVLLAAWITIVRGRATENKRPANPRAPLDAAYYAQPLRRRVLAGLLGVRARPQCEDWLPDDYQPTHHDEGAL